MALGTGVLNGVVVFAAGPLLSKLRRADIRGPLIAVMGVTIVSTIGYVLGFSSRSTIVSMGFLLVSMSVSNLIGAPLFSSIQELAKPEYRSTALALAVTPGMLFGAGGGPQLVGAASDLLAAPFGIESLRWSLVGLSAICGPWVLLHYFLALRGHHAGRGASIGRCGVSCLNTDDLPVIVLTGTAEERGLQYGEELRSKIRECSRVYLDLIGKTRGVAPLAYLEEFMAGTGYEAACQRLAPQLLDETRGMAEGAGISFLEAFAMQTIDEEWVYARNKSLASATAGGRCSAAGYVDSSGNYAVLAQNMDIGRWCDGFQVLLNHRHSNGTLTL